MKQMTKRMMNAVYGGVMLCALMFTTAANASNTAAQVVERVQVTSSGTAYFRPVGLGGWGGDDCPNATYTHINTSAAGYDTVLTLVMSSKLNNKVILFYGNCNAAGTYFEITYALLL